jgi:stage II sporulation protein E
MLKNNIPALNFSTIFARNVENGMVRVMLRAACGLFAGLLASRAEIFGKCAPFGIAVVAAASPGDGIFVLIGAMVGYLLPQGPEYAVRYVAAAVAVFMFKWVFSSFEELAAHPAFCPVLAGAASLITGIPVVMAGGMLPYDLILLFAETLLCGCAAEFFGHAFNYVRKPSGLWGLSQRELISVTISVCVLLLALERAQLAGISLGRIAAIVAILAAARYGKETGGAITGISTGMILSLNGGTMANMLAGYGFGGLIAGVFAPLGRIWCAAAFILANVVAGITQAGSAAQVLTSIYEVAVATLIFMLFPEKLLCRISGGFVPAKGAGERRLREAVHKRLLVTAQALEEISDTVRQVSGKLSHANLDDISSVYEDAAASTCTKCGNRLYCWGTVYNDTMNALNDASDTLKKNRSLTRDDVPKHFAARCCKLGEFVGTVNRCYAEFSARKAAELKTEQLRRLLTPQLGNAACLIRGVATEFSYGNRQTDGGERVKTALAACGLSTMSSQLSIDMRGRMTIEAEIDGKTTQLNRAQVLSALSSTCGRKLEGPVMSRDEETGTVRLLFTQKPRFSVSFGEAAIQKTGEVLCGDACESFVDERGRAMLILSDGMGCGGSAAVDSNLTVGLMSRLLRCGFGFDEAAKVAGAAMMVKSGEESFSTLDIACIDLFDGAASFFKAGAPPTYIRRLGRVERIESCSMPIGILENVQLEKVSSHLHSGDVVVVVSDGVVMQDDNFIIKAIEKFSGEPRVFARKLAQTAKELRDDGHDDDITVLAAVIA